MTKITEIPCIKCLIRPLCMNKKTIRCEILLDYLDNVKYNTYPMWSIITGQLREAFKGNWCVVGINNKATKIQRDRKLSDSFR